MEGTGEIRIESTDRAAGYFTTRSDVSPKVSARTSGVYWRADPADMSILDSGDDRQRAELIAGGSGTGSRSPPPDTLSGLGDHAAMPLEPTARSATRSERPSRSAAAPGAALRFVVQRHAARSLHYDFRLERDGVLLSWAVPKGVPLALGERHLAVHVEDHPLDYGDFEGEIPAGQYGAGTVEIWDRGTYELVEEKKDGGLTVQLHGERLDGLWTLVPAHLDGKEKNWLLLRKDAGTEKRDYAPMLATATDALPIGEGWAFEPKWDGFRALARIDGGVATFRSRNDNDLTTRFAAGGTRARPRCPLTLCRARRRDLRARRDRPLGVRAAAAGRRRARLRRLRRARSGRRAADRPHLRTSGARCSSSSLDTSVAGVLVSPSFDDGAALERAAREHGLEGVVAKLVDSHYRPGPPLDGLAQAEAEEPPGARHRRLHPRPGPPLERDRGARARRPRRRRAPLRGQRRHRLHRP